LINPLATQKAVTYRKEPLIKFPLTEHVALKEANFVTPKRLHEESNMPKKVLIALPPAMLEQVDFIAQCEHRTRSDLIREALRRYLDNFRRQQGGTLLSVSTMEMSDSFQATPVAGSTSGSST